MKSPKSKNNFSNFAKFVSSLLICLFLTNVSATAQKRSLLDESPVKEEATESSIESVSPIFWNGNPSCKSLNDSNDSRLAHITTDFELKLDSPLFPFNGNYNFVNDDPRQFYIGPNGLGDNNVETKTNSSRDTLWWESSLAISAVIVKGGSNANVYPYPQGAFSDSNLKTPLQNNRRPDISHITFCFYVPAKVTIIKEVQTFDQTNASTQAFPFTATNFGVSNFSLIDNNSQPADRISKFVYSFGASKAVTVTESLVQNWSLDSITCTETSGFGLPNAQNSSVSVANRKATIVLEQGEKVTCKFKNLQVAPSAASAFVSGRVLTETGLPLRRAAVSIFNANTLETQTVYTNQLGYYRVDNLPVNDFYIVSVAHGKRAFSNNSQSFTLSDNLTDINFFVLY
jgi:hypothetical protein